jgi:hypothetical protein
MIRRQDRSIGECAMTSGHEGGQYGPPPQGQPPYGYQPYGYAPAPAAPGGFGAPAPVERPVTVRAGLGAFIASVVLSLVGTVVTWLNWDTYLDEAIAQDPTLSGEAGVEAQEFAEAFSESFGVFLIVFGLVFAALYLLFVWFAWKGHNWSRIVLWVLGGLGVISGVSSLGMAGAGGAMASLTALSGFSALALAVGIVLLALKPSNDWYRYEKWRRAAGVR